MAQEAFGSFVCRFLGQFRAFDDLPVQAYGKCPYNVKIEEARGSFQLLAEGGKGQRKGVILVISLGCADRVRFAEQVILDPQADANSRGASTSTLVRRRTWSASRIRTARSSVIPKYSLRSS